jgi:two-component system response regulator QseB
MRLLLVEDDPMIGEALARGLRGDGFALDWAHDALEADTALRTQSYDLALFDLGLPRGDGLSLLRTLRARGDAMPVLIVTT